jgi:hypothetical protein
MDYTFISDSGQIVDFTPNSFAPLGIADLWSLKNEYSGNKLSLNAIDPKINGITQIGSATLRGNFKFHEQPEPFALIPGGWLPMPLASPQNFLVDRNVVDRLKKIHGINASASFTQFKFWLQLIEESAIFNPLLYALEGNKGRKPSFSEFILSFNEGLAAIKKALPKCKTICYSTADYESAYQTLELLARRTENETKFLEIVRPILANRIKRGSESSVKSKLIKAAKDSNVQLLSITFITALSCLYDDPHGKIRSIGREVLKPHKSMIFNALSDIRSIELAWVNQIYFKDKYFSLATRDHGLASLWCALAPVGEKSEVGDATFTFDLAEELFPRLDHADIIKIQELLHND